MELNVQVMPYGELTVNLVSARDLKDMDLIGKMSPYCVVSLGPNKKKSDIAKRQGRNPTWEQEITFPIIEGHTDVRIDVWDEDVGSDDLIGSVTLPLGGVFGRGFEDAWHRLGRHDGKAAGEVRVILRFVAHVCCVVWWCCCCVQGCSV